MAKRDNRAKRTNTGTAARASAASAADTLEHLAGVGTNASRKPARLAASSDNKGRSGGVVDAPGKKHRKPMPDDPRATGANAQASDIRTGKTMVKTSRLRGRG